MNFSIRISITVLLALIMNMDVYSQTGQQEYSNVTIEPVFSQGQLPLEGTLEIYPSGGGRIYKMEVKQTVNVRLPYGKYLIRLNDPRFTSTSREVTIDRPESFYVLSRALTNFVGHSESPKVAIRIKVQPTSACGSGGFLWAKMVGVYSTYSMEQKIGPDGTALFESLDDGFYVIMIADDDQLRAIESVKTTVQETVVDIKLFACAPASKP
jgi:hypothetical protein